MTTVHLVYPHGPRISCPDAIGRNLGKHLEENYNVVYYDWDNTQAIKPAPGDTLIGHAHPAPWTCFRRSLSRPGWRRVLALQPYNHGDYRQVAFLDPVLPHCDLFLAITGNYWFNSIDSSCYAHWQPKMLHIDLAVDRNDFAVLKRSFNRPGQRKFVYIGHAGWTKNTSYLSRIAALMPESAISWIGSGYPSIRGLTRLGFQDFATDQGRLSVAAHDFMITVGKADANPTTILEAMAWGLIPVCTPQSGYVDQPGIVNIPIDDAAQAVTILRQLQAAPESKLQEMQANNWQALNNHYNWNRFAEQVMAAIESDISPEVGHVSATNRLYLRWLALTSPHSAWRPSNFLRFFARNLWRQRHTQFSQSG